MGKRGIIKMGLVALCVLNITLLEAKHWNRNRNKNQHTRQVNARTSDKIVVNYVSNEQEICADNMQVIADRTAGVVHNRGNDRLRAKKPLEHGRLRRLHLPRFYYKEVDQQQREQFRNGPCPLAQRFEEAQQIWATHDSKGQEQPNINGPGILLTRHAGVSVTNAKFTAVNADVMPPGIRGGDVSREVRNALQPHNGDEPGHIIPAVLLSRRHEYNGDLRNFYSFDASTNKAWASQEKGIADFLNYRQSSIMHFEIIQLHIRIGNVKLKMQHMPDKLDRSQLAIAENWQTKVMLTLLATK